MKMQLSHSYDEVISVENLLAAWQEFLPGKRSKPDVQAFALHLMDNILQLHTELANRTYQHSGYVDFHITDPKPRHIHKALVRDRLLHHAVYRVLYPFFDRTFIADSYACRVDKGGYKALERFRRFALRVSQNNTQTCWVLKCDIQKFFASIDQAVLLAMLQHSIPDTALMDLLRNIIESFSTAPGKGLPLGNLTSQLFVNVYMNTFDQFVKHRLGVKYYIRYADDFVFFSDDREWLVDLVPLIQQFLDEQLHLTLHPRKVTLTTLASGVDFLGWVHFSYHHVLRTATKRRMFDHVRTRAMPATLQSYKGLIRHGNTYGLKQQLLNEYWLWREGDRF